MLENAITHKYNLVLHINTFKTVKYKDADQTVSVVCINI